ncbi:SAM-dependent methyltransferase [Microlunatus parietis]|uniref:2-polyprenyl-3-methyl-5-hydroxy-6-metoxy-1, 4-benzoquinol methylase n=1 Tax=Microlunatus parietis TaxID=682979 RepID=A0A7Y9LA59_9ACTN|nr:class I SAM-dependent methyltransferase [Microlunatus parietis]NYE70307.1 2-polyprenyl-3-methyl-5-hydroxy-6-metoxy-1,4-benzoquinol methylase [Microlunatus parietis]
MIIDDPVATRADAEGAISRLVAGGFILAALAPLTSGETETLDRDTGRLLAQAGLAVPDGDEYRPSPGLAELLASPDQARFLNLLGNLRQMVTAASGVPGWSANDDQTLLAQGRASVAGTRLMLTTVIPGLPGLDSAIRAEGAAVLDIGVGAGGIAATLAGEFPGLRVVGIDVLDRAIRLATAQVEQAGVADRVELRLQDVAELTDDAAYEMIWLPGIFVPQQAVLAAIPRLHRALRPGGWLLVGALRDTDDPLWSAINRWRVVRDGGCPLTATEVIMELRQAGFTEITTPEVPRAAPALIAARRPLPQAAA